jgi:hypothetical protein
MAFWLVVMMIFVMCGVGFTLFFWLLQVRKLGDERVFCGEVFGF